jgi:hypothetical protein
MPSALTVIQSHGQSLSLSHRSMSRSPFEAARDVAGANEHTDRTVRASAVKNKEDVLLGNLRAKSRHGAGACRFQLGSGSDRAPPRHAHVISPH